MLQITEHDANAHVREEYSLRKNHFHRAVQLDVAEGSGKAVYRMIRGTQPKTLCGVPAVVKAHATLCRQSKSQVQTVKISSFKQFHVGQHAFFGDATILILKQNETVITFNTVSGKIPTQGSLEQSSFAYNADEIAAEFEKFWSPIWNRDTDIEEVDLSCWQDFQNLVETFECPQFDIRISLDDPEIWFQTIHALKSHRAQGVCGWRAEELKLLPFRAVKHLCTLFNHLIFPNGMPAELMKARVVLLAKVPDPKSMKDGRPITILSLLVRLASKVIADQALRQLSAVLPPSISGGLPGRGARDHIMLQHAEIESAISSKTDLGGYTLDLVKAFNKIPRAPLKALFHKFGVCPVATNYWFSSLSRLVRHCNVLGSLGPPVGSTCGVPEGDSASVLAMVLLSSAFYYAHVSPQLTPYAYADNWSWLSTSTREQIRAVQKVLSFTTSIRMDIDHTKSWCWGTTKSFRDACQNINLLFPDGLTTIDVRTEAKDLGIQINYNKAVILGSQKDRLQNGISRCERLKWIPLSIQEKAKMIQTAIWPTALYSADSLTLGAKHFDNLRRAATNALVYEHKIASTVITCACFSPALQDPLVFVVVQLLRNFRRIVHYFPDKARAMFQFAKSFDQKNSYGPAGAMATYLSKIGWSFGDNGVIHGPLGYHLDLFTSSSKEIKRCITMSWHSQVQKLCAHRKGITEHVPDCALTARVFQQLPPCDQSFIALNLNGGFQSGSIKQHWSDENAIACPLCGLDETRIHRVLECHALQGIRDKHNCAVEILQNIRPEWVYHPIARQHEDAAFLRLVFRTRDFPPLEPFQLHEQGNPIRIYTDGSCEYPCLVDARRAAWAIVQDLTQSSDQRKFLGTTINDHVEPSQYLYVHTTGLVFGSQSAARAELSAVAFAILCMGITSPVLEMDIFTDSQYVCNLVAKLVKFGSACFNHKTPNFDLVHILITRWDSSRYRLHKVKAHTSIDDHDDGIVRWHTLANHLADTAAGKAVTHDDPVILQASLDVANHQTLEADRLSTVFRFIVAMNHARSQRTKHLLSQVQRDTDNAGGSSSMQQSPYDHAYSIMINWNPDNYHSPVLPVLSTPIYEAVSLGPSIACQVWDWLRLLKWPQEEDALAPNGPDDFGISYLELVFNFGLCAQRLLPVVVDSKAHPVVYVQYSSDEAKMLPKHTRAANYQICTLEKVIRQLSNFTKSKPIPDIPQPHRKPCRSLANLGFRVHAAGIPKRPVIPLQEETMHCVKQYLEHLPNRDKFDQPLVIPVRDALVATYDIPDLSPVHRVNAAARLRHRLRQLE